MAWLEICSCYVRLVHDGGKKSQVTGEITKETVKPLCGECSCALSHRTRGCGRIRSPGIPRALYSEGRYSWHTSDALRCELAPPCFAKRSGAAPNLAAHIR